MPPKYDTKKTLKDIYGNQQISINYDVVSLANILIQLDNPQEEFKQLFEAAKKSVETFNIEPNGKARGEYFIRLIGRLLGLKLFSDPRYSKLRTALVAALQDYYHDLDWDKELYANSNKINKFDIEPFNKDLAQPTDPSKPLPLIVALARGHGRFVRYLFENATADSINNLFTILKSDLSGNKSNPLFRDCLTNLLSNHGHFVTSIVPEIFVQHSQWILTSEAAPSHASPTFKNALAVKEFVVSSAHASADEKRHVSSWVDKLFRSHLLTVFGNPIPLLSDLVLALENLYGNNRNFAVAYASLSELGSNEDNGVYRYAQLLLGDYFYHGKSGTVDVNQAITHYLRVIPLSSFKRWQAPKICNVVLERLNDCIGQLKEATPRRNTAVLVCMIHDCFTNEKPNLASYLQSLEINFEDHAQEHADYAIQQAINAFEENEINCEHIIRIMLSIKRYQPISCFNSAAEKFEKAMFTRLNNNNISPQDCTRCLDLLAETFSIAPERIAATVEQFVKDNLTKYQNNQLTKEQLQEWLTCCTAEIPTSNRAVTDAVVPACINMYRAKKLSLEDLNYWMEYCLKLEPTQNADIAEKLLAEIKTEPDNTRCHELCSAAAKLGYAPAYIVWADLYMTRPREIGGRPKPALAKNCYVLAEKAEWPRQSVEYLAKVQDQEALFNIIYQQCNILVTRGIDATCYQPIIERQIKDPEALFNILYQLVIRGINNAWLQQIIERQITGAHKAILNAMLFSAKNTKDDTGRAQDALAKDNGVTQTTSLAHCYQIFLINSLDPGFRFSPKVSTGKREQLAEIAAMEIIERTQRKTDEKPSAYEQLPLAYDKSKQAMYKADVVSHALAYLSTKGGKPSEALYLYDHEKITQAVARFYPDRLPRSSAVSSTSSTSSSSSIASATKTTSISSSNSYPAETKAATTISATAASNTVATKEDPFVYPPPLYAKVDPFAHATPSAPPLMATNPAFLTPSMAPTLNTIATTTADTSVKTEAPTVNVTATTTADTSVKAEAPTVNATATTTADTSTKVATPTFPSVPSVIPDQTAATASTSTSPIADEIDAFQFPSTVNLPKLNVATSSATLVAVACSAPTTTAKPAAKKTAPTPSVLPNDDDDNRVETTEKSVSKDDAFKDTVPSSDNRTKEDKQKAGLAKLAAAFGQYKPRSKHHIAGDDVSMATVIENAGSITVIRGPGGTREV